MRSVVPSAARDLGASLTPRRVEERSSGTSSPLADVRLGVTEPRPHSDRTHSPASWRARRGRRSRSRARGPRRRRVRSRRRRRSPLRPARARNREARMRQRAGSRGRWRRDARASSPPRARRRGPPVAPLRMAGLRPHGRASRAEGPRQHERDPLVLPRPRPRVQQVLELLRGHDRGADRGFT